jgi:hypothetical protein
MNLTGYLLLRQTSGDYKGVQDRVYAWPDHESDELARAFIETTHQEPFDFIFRDQELANQALALAAAHERELSVYEVGVAADVKDLAAVRLPIGIDVAYPGGDFYSAVQNGLLGSNPSSDLRDRYGSALNVNRLFDYGEGASDFLASFRAVTLSESDSDFVFYALGSTDRVQ